MAVEYRFMKNFVTTPTQPLSHTVSIIQTLVKPEDVDSINVAYNGQLIRLRTSEPISTFSRYYYEVVLNNEPYLSTPEATNIEEFCSLTINIYANPTFIAPGYSSGAQDTNLSSSDVIYISLWHTLVRNV